MITLYAFGRFRLSDDEERDITPRGMKARALIALLALAPDHRRPRAWLQDKLWSERSAKKGSESLRQVLTEIRHSLGLHSRALVADREAVALDKAIFCVDTRRRGVKEANDAADFELFSDLNVSDGEFEQWIRTQRANFDHPPPATIRSIAKKAPAIFFSVPRPQNTPAADMVITFLLAMTTTSLLDFADFQIFHADQDTVPLGPPPDSGMCVSLTQGLVFGQVHLNVTVSDVLHRRIFWSKNFASISVHGAINEDAIAKVASDMVEAILSTLERWKNDLSIEDCAVLLVNQARQSIFRFDKRSLRHADSQFAQAYSYEARPQILAWRAFLRNIANFQHRTTAFLPDQIDIDILAQQAIREAPRSAISLGIRAHIEYLSGGSPRSSLNLARRAVSADPLNAINHAILSNTELVLGKLGDSRASSSKALELAGSAECRSFVEFFCCMSASAMGDYDEAIDHAEAALLLKPAFIAPLRYLIALYSQSNRTAALQRAVALLRVNEPSFQIKHLLDSNYPVHTLRRIPLIEAIRP